MNGEEIKMICDALASLGIEAKGGFIVWVIAKTVTGPLIALIICIAAFKTVKEFGRWAGAESLDQALRNRIVDFLPPSIRCKWSYQNHEGDQREEIIRLVKLGLETEMNTT